MNSNGFSYFILETNNGVDVFTKLERKLAITESLNYFVSNKGLSIFVWLLTWDKLHLVVKSSREDDVVDIISELKRFTSKKINKILEKENDNNSRHLLAIFSKENTQEFFLWNDIHKIEQISESKKIDNIIDLVHEIPVKERIVEKQDHYVFSSSCDFHGWKGLVEVNADI
jgi:REP element-mobilizing transposase RayT